MSLVLSTKNYLEFLSSTVHTQKLDGLELTYVANEDSNGLFYYLGTNKGASGWTNPVTAGQMSIVVRTLQFGNPADLVDRTTNQWYTSNVANSFVGIDIGLNRLLTLNSYTIRNRVESVEYLRTWNLEGSNNVAGNTIADYAAATWEAIDVRTGDSSLLAANAFGHFDANMNNKKRYRFFRLIQTGPNGSSNAYLCIAELEFYGLFKETT